MLMKKHKKEEERYKIENTTEIRLKRTLFTFILVLHDYTRF